MWYYELDLVDLWKSASNEEIMPREVARKIALVLSTRHDLSTIHNLKDVIESFETLDVEATWDDFDVILDRLYDWADDARCWVKTFLELHEETLSGRRQNGG